MIFNTASNWFGASFLVLVIFGQIPTGKAALRFASRLTMSFARGALMRAKTHREKADTSIVFPDPTLEARS